MSCLICKKRIQICVLLILDPVSWPCWCRSLLFLLFLFFFIEKEAEGNIECISFHKRQRVSAVNESVWVPIIVSSWS